MNNDNHIHNIKCQSPQHEKHLCYIVSQGFHLTEKAEYEAITKAPEFKCQHCGRTAKSEENLCEPAKL